MNIETNTGTILVIGNGFDLHHGKQTKYLDFLGFMKELRTGFNGLDASTKSEIEELHITNFEKASLYSFFLNQYAAMGKNSNWIDMEEELKRLIHRVIEFVDDVNESRIKSGVWGQKIFLLDERAQKYQILFETLKSIFENPNPGKFAIKDTYYDSWGKVDLNTILEQLSAELSELERLLWYYLCKVEPKRHESKVRYKNLMDELNPDYLISFNYTDTCEDTYGISREDICYIHGSVENMGSLVLGYDDLDGRTDDLLFKKYYRRMEKDTDIIKGERLYNIKNGVHSRKTLVFYGHSLNVSDEDVLNMLIRCTSDIIVYVRNKAEKATKIANLIKLIGKEETVNRIQNKTIKFRDIKPI